jgi:hypothetical protein
MLVVTVKFEKKSYTISNTIEAYHNASEGYVSGDSEGIAGKEKAHWQLEVGHHVASPDRGTI